MDIVTKSKIKLLEWYFKTVLKNNQVDFNDKNFCINWLKQRGYNSYGNVYTKGFVIVMIILDSKKNIQYIEISIDVPNGKKTVIKENFATGLMISLEYFKSFSQ